jgi:hypothetical protein
VQLDVLSRWWKVAVTADPVHTPALFVCGDAPVGLTMVASPATTRPHPPVGSFASRH